LMGQQGRGISPGKVGVERPQLRWCSPFDLWFAELLPGALAGEEDEPEYARAGQCDVAQGVVWGEGDSVQPEL
ncbi:J domain-containing protein, partial [Salmonella enterica]